MALFKQTERHLYNHMEIEFDVGPMAIEFLNRQIFFSFFWPKFQRENEWKHNKLLVIIGPLRVQLLPLVTQLRLF